MYIVCIEGINYEAFHSLNSVIDIVNSRKDNLDEETYNDYIDKLNHISTYTDLDEIEIEVYVVETPQIENCGYFLIEYYKSCNYIQFCDSREKVFDLIKGAYMQDFEITEEFIDGVLNDDASAITNEGGDVLLFLKLDIKA